MNAFKHSSSRSHFFKELSKCLYVQSNFRCCIWTGLIWVRYFQKLLICIEFLNEVTKTQISSGLTVRSNANNSEKPRFDIALKWDTSLSCASDPIIHMPSGALDTSLKNFLLCFYALILLFFINQLSFSLIKICFLLHFLRSLLDYNFLAADQMMKNYVMLVTLDEGLILLSA